VNHWGEEGNIGGRKLSKMEVSVKGGRTRGGTCNEEVESLKPRGEAEKGGPYRGPGFQERKKGFYFVLIGREKKNNRS